MDSTIDNTMESIDKSVFLFKPPIKHILKQEHKIMEARYSLTAEGLLADVTIDAFGNNNHEGYDCLVPYWNDTKRILQSPIHSGFKAKEAFEFRKAVNMYDRTADAEGFQAGSRQTVLDGLWTLIRKYCSENTADLPIKPTGNIECPPESNQPALIAKLFSDITRIDELYRHAKAGKFVNDILYSTKLLFPRK